MLPKTPLTFDLLLNWSAYDHAGMGDAYADIPKDGGSFANAVAACINSRKCENLDRGLMCPSYRISENPDLSTGGRVRKLKEALNSAQGVQALFDPSLSTLMDLCVNCKGCKRECENEVDMALIKMEWLAQKYKAHGLPLRARLIGSMPHWLVEKKWMRALIQLRNSSILFRKIGEIFLGLNARVDLPLPAKQSADDTIINPNSDKTVILFIDSFTRHFKPEIVESAKKVLAAGGYKVICAQSSETDQPRPLCCGRTFLSQGQPDQARIEAERLLKALKPHLLAGHPIVGLEASCITMFRQEYHALGLGDDADLLHEKAMLFEAFITREMRAKRFDVAFKPWTGKDVVIHGHCHQKSIGAMPSMRKALKLVPDLKPRVLETSCCGMAGGFGLEAEHGVHAQKMADVDLLPQLHENPEALIAANGFSCRHRIEDSTQRKALHIAEILCAQLPDPL